MTFGTLEHCFVLNTPVNSKLNKFVTPVTPSSDKINNSVFYLAISNKTTAFKRPCLKHPHQFAQFFGIIEQRRELYLLPAYRASIFNPLDHRQLHSRCCHQCLRRSTSVAQHSVAWVKLKQTDKRRCLITCTLFIIKWFQSQRTSYRGQLSPRQTTVVSNVSQ